MCLILKGRAKQKNKTTAKMRRKKRKYRMFIKIDVLRVTTYLANQSIEAEPTQCRKAGPNETL